MKKIVILLVTAMLLYMCSCGTDDIDISGYSDAEIALEGISDETAAVTVKQLKAIIQLKQKAQVTRSEL